MSAASMLCLQFCEFAAVSPAHDPSVLAQSIQKALRYARPLALQFTSLDQFTSLTNRPMLKVPDTACLSTTLKA